MTSWWIKGMTQISRTTYSSRLYSFFSECCSYFRVYRAVLYIILRPFLLTIVLFFTSYVLLRAFEVPILLIVVFEITYLVHKRRSVNFCGMYFDEGVRVKNVAFMSCMLRNSIRTLATVLLVMNLLVNLDLIQSGAPVDEVGFLL